MAIKTMAVDKFFVAKKLVEKNFFLLRINMKKNKSDREHEYIFCVTNGFMEAYEEITRNMSDF